MKKSILSLLLFMNLFSIAQQNVFDWVKGIEANATQSVVPMAVCVDKAGNIYTAGTFKGTIDFDPGAGVANQSSFTDHDNVFVSKLDSTGNFKLVKVMTGPSIPEVKGIKLDAAGNIYVMGKFYGILDFDPGPANYKINASSGKYNDSLSAAFVANTFVVKLDGSGNFKWAKAMNVINELGSECISNDLVLDSASNVYLAGIYKGDLDADPGAGVHLLPCKAQNHEYNSFFLKLNTDGNFVWAGNFEGRSLVTISDFDLDHSNNIYVTGEFSDTVDFDPSPATHKLYGLSAYTAKLSASGNLIWVKPFAEPMAGAAAYTTNIKIGSSGNIYTIGVFSGTIDFDPSPVVFTMTGKNYLFTLKWNDSGNFVWAKSFETDVLSGFTYITQTLDQYENIYTSGMYYGIIDFDPGPGSVSDTSAGSIDLFLTKLNSAGELVYAKTIGSKEQEGGYDITVDAAGTVYSTGTYQGNVDFDPDAGTVYLDGKGHFNGYVLKLKSSGIISSVLSTENNALSLSLYPNPACGSLTVELLECAEKGSLEIINMAGEVVYKEMIDTKAKEIINIQKFKKGVYLLRLTTKDTVRNKKFVIN